MVKNLDKEYTSVNVYYEQQKQYRQTSEGKLALRRSKEKQILKNMSILYCQSCKFDEFECLTTINGKTLCYNCKYRRYKVLKENEICLNK